MPNAKVLSEKQAVVAELTEKLQNAAAGAAGLIGRGGVNPPASHAFRVFHVFHGGAPFSNHSFFLKEKRIKKEL